MASRLILKERLILADDLFAELVVWEVDPPVKASPHSYKYRLALIKRGNCVLRYDNELGKSDHRHAGRKEKPYDFVSVDQLLDDFLADVARWKEK